MNMRSDKRIQLYVFLYYCIVFLYLQFFAIEPNANDVDGTVISRKLSYKMPLF